VVAFDPLASEAILASRENKRQGPAT